MANNNSDDFEVDSDLEMEALQLEATNRVRIKTGKAKFEKKKKPVIKQPLTAWKTSDALRHQFAAELECARMRHQQHKARCASLQIKPVTAQIFVFQSLIQSGWALHDGQFVLK